MFSDRRATVEPSLAWALPDTPELAATAPAGRARNPARQGMRLNPFESCANSACTSGWLQLLRSRAAPIFEGSWSCSARCMEAQVEAAVRREMGGAGGKQVSHRHRIPLGLVMLEQGWITYDQLRLAIDAQRLPGAGRLGHWLVRHVGVSEQLVTRALGLQWSCPVLPIQAHDVDAFTVLLPRLFVDAFAALPLRLAAGKLLYLGFEDRLDPVLALAIERMMGLRVENGLVRGSLFRAEHARMLGLQFPAVELIEAASETAAVSALTASLERARPVASRLVRAHDCLWLRMWLRPQHGPLPEMGAVQDLVCLIGGR